MVLVALSLWVNAVDTKSKSLRITTLGLDMPHETAVTLKGNPKSRKALKNGLYENIWADGTSAVFNSQDKIVELLGAPLVIGSVSISKGASGDLAIARGKTLSWPLAQIDFQPTDTPSFKERTLSSEEQAVIRYEFGDARLRIFLTQGKCEAMSLTKK